MSTCSFRDRGSKYPIRDRVMQVQASSVEFLCRNGFGFQKSFSKGVSWLGHCDEDSSRTELIVCFKPPSSEYMPSMVEQEASAVNKFVQRVNEWVSNEDTKVGDRKMVNLAEFNVDRRYILRAVEQQSPRVWVVFAGDGSKLGLVPSIRIELMETTKLVREKTVKLLQNAHFQKVERTIREALGLRRVIDMLLNANRPLVVHHGLYDTTKLLVNFIGQLPESFSGFET